MCFNMLLFVSWGVGGRAWKVKGPKDKLIRLELGREPGRFSVQSQEGGTMQAVCDGPDLHPPELRSLANAVEKQTLRGLGSRESSCCGDGPPSVGRVGHVLCLHPVAECSQPSGQWLCEGTFAQSVSTLIASLSGQQ